jgi:hypothetical protein
MFKIKVGYKPNKKNKLKEDSETLNRSVDNIFKVK